jgi:hypothetical protein
VSCRVEKERWREGRGGGDSPALVVSIRKADEIFFETRLPTRGGDLFSGTLVAFSLRAVVDSRSPASGVEEIEGPQEVRVLEFLLSRARESSIRRRQETGDGAIIVS